MRLQNDRRASHGRNDYSAARCEASIPDMERIPVAEGVACWRRRVSEAALPEFFRCPETTRHKGESESKGGSLAGAKLSRTKAGIDARSALV